MKNYIDTIYTEMEFEKDAFETLNVGLAVQAYKAREYLEEFYPYRQDLTYVIIEVEGYKCVGAIVTSNIKPYELADLVVPFDEDKIYPLQKLVTKYAFEKED